MGFHHVALATRDTAATHDFYTQVMGFTLVKVVTAPTPGEHGGWSKHFFYNTGDTTDNGMIAFWEIHDTEIGTDFPVDINTTAGLPWWVNHVAFDAPTIDDLIALGVLSPFEHYSLTGRPSADALVAAAIAAAPMWGPSLVFVATTDEAHTGVARLRAAGIQAAVALGDHRKESAITAFTAGQVQMLVSVHALTEGVDLPFVRTVFLRDSIRGPVVQAVGRALRRCGEKVANVVQFADAKHPYPLIATPRRRFVGPPNGPWCELTARPTWPDSIVSPATRTIS